MICDKSRYRVHTIAHRKAIHPKHKTTKIRPGIASNATSPTSLPMTKNTNGKIMMLCTKIRRLRQTMRKIWTKNGIGSCLIILSASINPLQPSLMTLVMKVHKIMPAARNGKYSSIGVLNSWPNTKPILAINTPILIVSQNGPMAERR